MLNRNKSECIKFSEVSLVRAALPKATIAEAIKLKKNGTVDDIMECTKLFPKAEISDVNTILGSRRFIRWCMNNKKVIAALTIATPAFAFTMYKLVPGSFALEVLNAGKRAVDTSTVDLFSRTGSNVIAGDGAVSTFAAAAAGGGFFAGKGVILLHMLVCGFFTLVVSSFLKFTGRGDLIPLVAFVGGAAILYEVIGLFTDIYSAIATMLNM